MTSMQEKRCILVHVFDAGKNEDKRQLGRPRLDGRNTGVFC
jgi:hypothetical protein